jgi:hypothetical protein
LGSISTRSVPPSQLTSLWSSGTGCEHREDREEDREDRDDSFDSFDSFDSYSFDSFVRKKNRPVMDGVMVTHAVGLVSLCFRVF